MLSLPTVVDIAVVVNVQVYNVQRIINYLKALEFLYVLYSCAEMCHYNNDII